MTPQTPITSLTGIGPRFRTLLHNLGIFTVQDLLYHFPHRYEDFTQSKKIVEIIPNETVTLNAYIIDVQNIFTKNRKRLTKARIRDETGEMYVIWFNQHFLKKTLKPAQQYLFSGKVQLFDRKPTLMASSVEEAGESTLNTNRLVPVYPETAGLSSKWLRTKINDILSQNLQMLELLPENILNAEKFPQVNAALKQIHFPSSQQNAQQARERFAFEELFTEMLSVEHRKSLWHEQMEGVPLEHEKFAKQVGQLEESLPFELSPSQKTAINEIFIELSGQHPMNRLLEGDVGAGKTIVAIFAAYLAHLNGYKTLYMAPTEILAQQHFQTFEQILAGQQINIQLQTGSVKNKSFGDITIGTHALLYGKEAIENVGLVIIDEQHRFGVEQRTRLANLNKQTKAPNLLTMTATPIPRTLTLTIYGDLSISALKPPANKIRKTTTKVVPDAKREAAYKWIKAKGKPTFIVCPFIESSEVETLANVKSAQTEFALLSDGVLKGVKMGLLHGKMKPTEKQAVIDQFKKGEIQVLVSTPVIEVGIDIPDASVIVIESAERYGLASLHQLRGRVGRDGNESYCLLFMSGFNKPAYARLKNLETITDGLELAEIDLRLRGGGDIYGTMQSGYKQFKLADLSDIRNLEKVKMYTQQVYAELNKYPILQQYLKNQEELSIGNN
jgi:ATP-dependent DNA helicase RecG